MGKLWDSLSRMVSSLEDRFGPAMAGTMLTSTSKVFRERLAQGHCILAMTYAGEEPMLWAFHGTEYWRVRLPSTVLRDWKTATPIMQVRASSYFHHLP